MNPINAIGAVTNHVSDKEYFLGTAFCYKSPRFLLTAAHMVSEGIEHLAITFPYVKKILVPTKIAIHEKYDIAALACTEKHINNRDVEGIEYFESISNDLDLAGDFLTYGYPEDITLNSGPLPTPRVFKGYYQRFFHHISAMGYEYSAIELNTPCPKGLSGSPIMVYGSAKTLTGLVAENIETSTELHEEEIDRGNKFIYRRVVNYGIAVRIGEIQEWIEEHYEEHGAEIL